MKSRGRLALYFGIPAAAAVALLAVFSVRGSGERTPIVTQVVKAPAAPGLHALPLPEPARSESVRPEAPAKDAVPPGKTQRPGSAVAASRRDETDTPGANVDRATIVALHGDKPLTRDHPHVATAIEIQERNTDWLMAHPAVVGTSVGLNDKGEIALVVLTKVAGATDIPAAIDGLPVVLWHTGEINARTPAPTQEQPGTREAVSARTATLPIATKFVRPVPIGVSTGLEFKYTKPYIMAGTLGCRVKDGVGNVYALSNNHVYAWENKAPLNARELQPGTLDSGSTSEAATEADKIGTLANFKKIVFGGSGSNEIDAAIALSSTGNLSNSTLPAPDGYGVPMQATVPPALGGVAVQKCGRTTGLTHGTITGINVTVKISYSHGVAKFVNQINITPGTFSASGDSGSLIVTDTRNPVGLLFAGSSSVTIANPIQAVLTAFGVTVDGE